MKEKIITVRERSNIKNEGPHLYRAILKDYRVSAKTKTIPYHKIYREDFTVKTLIQEIYSVFNKGECSVKYNGFYNAQPIVKIISEDPAKIILFTKQTFESPYLSLSTLPLNKKRYRYSYILKFENTIIPQKKSIKKFFNFKQAIGRSKRK